MYICKQYLNLYNLQEQDVDTKASINLNNVLNQNLNLMKEFEVFTTDGKVTYSFPTDASEIDASYLTAITANIHVAPHHTLVGLVYRERVSTIVMTYKQKKKGLDVGINPIFIKAGETDSNFISSLEIKDKDLDHVVGGYGEDYIVCEACNEIFTNFEDYRAHRCLGKT